MNGTLLCHADERKPHYSFVRGDLRPAEIEIKANLMGWHNERPFTVQLHGTDIDVRCDKKYRVTIEEVREPETHPYQ